LPSLNHASPVTTFVYDIGSNLLSSTDPRGVMTSYAYDALNRMVTEIDAFSYPSTLPSLNHASPVTTFVYDIGSNLIQTTSPRGFTTSIAYDALNREAITTEAVCTSDQRTTTSIYDAANNLIASTNGRGFTTSMTYDALNREVATTDALNHTTT